MQDCCEDLHPNAPISRIDSVIYLFLATKQWFGNLFEEYLAHTEAPLKREHLASENPSISEAIFLAEYQSVAMILHEFVLWE